MKQYVFFIIFIFCIVQIIKCDQNAFESAIPHVETDKKYKQYLKGQIKLSDKSLKVPLKKVYWEGWIKYFHYNLGERKNKPHEFYINNDYFNQVVLSNQRGNKDGNGYVNIPTRFHFYAKLMKDGLNIISARESDHISNTIDTLNIDLILPVPENKRFQGGIKDLGNFDEGKCIQIDSKIPSYFQSYFYSGRDKGITEHWIICTDEAQSKTNLINMLVRLRIIKQKSLGIKEIREINSKGITKKRYKMTMTTLRLAKRDKGVERYYGPGHNVNIDGYWILLNDWTQCTLKCGGGLSYQQWMCIPPKTGGKDCIGQAIRTKPCNDQPCFSPSGSGADGSGSKSDEESLIPSETNTVIAPVFKMLPFSNRPQKYIRCLIKEGDVLYKDYSRPLINDEAVKIPSRLVMNNSTIALYTDESYTSSIFTFKLTQVMLGKNIADSCCFNIKSNNRKYELCSFEKECGTIKNPTFFNEWKKDFAIFAESCYESLESGHGKDRLPTVRIIKKDPVTEEISAVTVSQVQGSNSGLAITGNTTPTAGSSASPATAALPQAELKEDNEIKRSIQSPSQEQDKMVSKAQTSLMEDREKQLTLKLESTEKKRMDNKIAKTQTTVMKAMKKEMQLEDLIRVEQTEKMAKSTKRLLKKFRHERKKKKCLDKILKQKEQEDEKTRETMEIESEIKKLKVRAIRQVRKKRQDLKSKLLEIKRKILRKNRIIEQQIQKIRGSMANELMQANKLGDWKICKAARESKPKMDDYCNANFSDNFNKNSECKDPENFCYVCCENEYGNMFLNKRDQCYEMCDELHKGDLDNGDWVWHNDILNKN